MSNGVSAALISVVMPAHNAARTIVTAIQSAQSQTYRDWELWVVDDGSTDGTAELVSQMAEDDARICLLRQDACQGPAAARNRALSEVRGRYLAFLDADDCWRSNKLEVQLAALKRFGASFCYSSYVVFKDGEKTGRLFNVPPSISYKEMLSGSVIGCSTVMYDRSVLGIQTFDDGREALSRSCWRYFFNRVGHEDYVAWMRLLARIEERNLSPPMGIAEPLMFYRISAQSFSANKLKVAAYQFFNYSQMLGLRGWELWRHFIAYAMGGFAKRWRSVSVINLPAELCS
jgi:teichuronic acid biosynthesis glycosyltransferase TuaG